MYINEIWKVVLCWFKFLINKKFVSERLRFEIYMNKVLCLCSYKIWNIYVIYFKEKLKLWLYMENFEFFYFIDCIGNKIF